jgi:hypothetical protein
MTNSKGTPMTDKTRPTDISYVCGICIRAIEDNQEEAEVVIPLDDGGTQRISVHKICLKKILHPTIPVGF